MSLPLLTNIDAVQTTIEVGSAITDSPNGGTLVIESELITYKSADSSRFYGCVRGDMGSTAVAHVKDIGVTYTPFPSGLLRSAQVIDYKFLKQATDISTYQTLLTVPTSGLYRINVYRVVTADATGTDAPGDVIVGWTDESGPQALAFGAGISSTAGSFSGLSMVVSAVSGTPIKFYTNGTFGPWATLLTNIYITAEAL